MGFTTGDHYPTDSGNMDIKPSHPIGIVVEDDHSIFREAKQKMILMIRFGYSFKSSAVP